MKCLKKATNIQLSDFILATKATFKLKRSLMNINFVGKMNNSKLIPVLKSFDKQEVLQFKKFVNSPFHNKHKAVIQLTDYLLKRLNGDPEYLSKKIIHTELFPNQPYNDLKLRHVISYLQRQVEEFLIQKELEKDSLNKKVQLVKACRKRNLDKYFDLQENKIAKQFENSPTKDLQFHFTNYQFKEERYARNVQKTKDVASDLQASSDSLDNYFILSKLKHACNAFSHRKILKTDYHLNFIDEVIQHVEARKLDNVPAIGIYYYTYLTITSGEENYFEQLKQRITDFQSLFELDEIRGIYLLAINHCIQRLNRGEEKYLREAFELYRLGIENNILLESGYLSPWTYKNIASAGIKLKEFKWTSAFIDGYKAFVYEEYQEQFSAFNKANLFLHQQRFKAAADTIHKAEIHDLFTLLGANVILIKSHFELSDFDYLEYQLNNFKKLLQRKEVLTYHKKNYSNFVRFTKRLINLKTFDAAKKKKLVNDINKAEILTEKDWLMTKINEI
jgi:hypothetical protein